MASSLNAVSRLQSGEYSYIRQVKSGVWGIPTACPNSCEIVCLSTCDRVYSWVVTPISATETATGSSTRSFVPGLMLKVESCWLAPLQPRMYRSPSRTLLFTILVDSFTPWFRSSAPLSLMSSTVSMGSRIPAVPGLLSAYGLSSK